MELRGRVGGESRISMFGAGERPASAAAVVAVSTSLAVLEGGFSAGAYGLAGIADPLALLNTIAERGVRPLRFEGVSMYY